MKRRLLNIKRGGSSGGFDFTSDLMAYWKLATNSLDSSGRGHNGTDTSMTYAGGYAQFGTGYIFVVDSDDFSFTDGVNDISAHFLISFIWNDKTGTQYLINKRHPINTENEWQIGTNGTQITFVFWNNSGSGFIVLRIPYALINTGVLNTLQFSYNGSKSHTGLKAYLNGNNAVGFTEMNGTYIGQVNGNSNIGLGAAAWNGGNVFKGNGKEWAIWKNREMTPEEITEIDRRVKAGEPLI